MLNYNRQKNWTNNFGNQQSPIMINTHDLKPKKGNLAFKPKSHYVLIREVDELTTIKLTGRGKANIFGRPFDFKQVHFHSQSEHVIDGKPAAMEIHLVHENKIGQLAVVALMVNEGPANPEFQQIIDRFESGMIDWVDFDITNWVSFDPKGFHYLGSLTTPPLQEGVEWIVIDNTMLTVDGDQLNWFRSKFHKDYRALQPLHGRTIEWYK